LWQVLDVGNTYPAILVAYLAVTRYSISLIIVTPFPLHFLVPALLVFLKSRIGKERPHVAVVLNCGLNSHTSVFFRGGIPPKWQIKM
jgi:hypothetical protein